MLSSGAEHFGRGDHDRWLMDALPSLARMFGECELTMPEDFVAEVKRYIHEWRLSPRLRQSIARMQDQALTQVGHDECKDLIDKNELARSKVEAMIDRLRSME